MSPRRDGLYEYPATSRALFEYVLGDEPVEEPLLRHLIATRIPEDEHLDYKSGALVGGVGGFPDRAATAKLRRQVTGFANADGGLLVVGLDAPEPDEDGTQPVWSVLPCSFSPNGRQSWGQWVTDTLGKALKIKVLAYRAVGVRPEVSWIL